MKYALLPGYRDLFGTTKLTYEQWLENLPTDNVISWILCFNAELYTEEPSEKTQERLVKQLSSRFTHQEKTRINEAYTDFFFRSNKLYKRDVFANRYLLYMLTKEVERNNIKPNVDLTGEDEFNFFMAYLMAVDEIHQIDEKIANQVVLKEKDTLSLLRVIWQGGINQFIFSDLTNPAFEYFKLIGFLMYLKENYRNELRAYLAQFGFNRTSQFLASHKQTLLDPHKYATADSPFKKWYRIVPNDNMDKEYLAYLNSLILNNQLGKKTTIYDLKKWPLYYSSRLGYMLIDENFYTKKIYNGIFFEFYHKTDLKNQIKSLPDYLAIIASKVTEEIYFRTIIRNMISKYDVFRFDDADSMPDVYCRHNKDIYIIEFKAAIVADQHSADPNFDKLLKLIQERFIVSVKGKPKGITQLKNVIEDLVGSKLNIDQGFEQLKHDKRRLTIYPIICHDDFHFTMPGINDYLNEKLNELMSFTLPNGVEVKPLTMISLQNLFDFMLHGGTMYNLKSIIGNYNRFKQSREKKLVGGNDLNSIHRMKIGFDEYYREQAGKQFDKSKFKGKWNKIEGLDFTAEMLNEII